uniref:Uncharacterized protein n=1 Tax=Candidatus Kentrum sp. LPFa TaxID=2126335 RepID=A0A450Y3R5_9GAMM|nr:MAG: hypothetical protein BECKLPF1236A_GA0070988_105101 [Candidatus Kentron sp. LPFa]VFK36188.1 MAG: hypothetical protein BECKLPF1236C_GA0070990_105112 [Candidatus Kentron sp. LPFa]
MQVSRPTRVNPGAKRQQIKDIAERCAFGFMSAKNLSKEVAKKYGEQLYKASEVAIDFFEQNYQKYANPDFEARFFRVFLFPIH